MRKYIKSIVKEMSEMQDMKFKFDSEDEEKSPASHPETTMSQDAKTMYTAGRGDLHEFAIIGAVGFELNQTFSRIDGRRKKDESED